MRKNTEHKGDNSLKSESKPRLAKNGDGASPSSLIALFPLRDALFNLRKNRTIKVATRKRCMLGMAQRIAQYGNNRGIIV